MADPVDNGSVQEAQWGILNGLPTYDGFQTDRIDGRKIPQQIPTSGINFVKLGNEQTDVTTHTAIGTDGAVYMVGKSPFAYNSSLHGSQDAFASIAARKLSKKGTIFVSTTSSVFDDKNSMVMAVDSAGGIWGTAGFGKFTKLADSPKSTRYKEVYSTEWSDTFLVLDDQGGVSRFKVDYDNQKDEISNGGINKNQGMPPIKDLSIYRNGYTAVAEDGSVWVGNVMYQFRKMASGDFVKALVATKQSKAPIYAIDKSGTLHVFECNSSCLSDSTATETHTISGNFKDASDITGNQLALVLLDQEGKLHSLNINTFQLSDYSESTKWEDTEVSSKIRALNRSGMTLFEGQSSSKQVASQLPQSGDPAASWSQIVTYGIAACSILFGIVAARKAKLS